jgi:hypothetical protein
MLLAKTDRQIQANYRAVLQKVFFAKKSSAPNAQSA